MVLVAARNVLVSTYTAAEECSCGIATCCFLFLRGSAESVFVLFSFTSFEEA